MSITDIALTLLGASLAATAFYDAFRTLFVPEGRGALNQAVAASSWRIITTLARRVRGERMRHRILRFAGPVIFGSVVTAWSLMLTVGFALIYLPHLVEEFRISSGLPAEEQTSLLDAIYFSFSALSSTGFGDISAKTDALRAITMLEGIAGTVMIGLGLSWLLSLYPAVGRRRALAETIALHRRAELDPATDDPALVRASTLALSDRVIEASRDMAKFPILYYFMETRAEASLPRQIGALIWARDRAGEASDEGVRRAGDLLGGALGSFRTTLRERFLGPVQDDRELIDEFVKDHLIERGEAATPWTEGEKRNE